MNTTTEAAAPATAEDDIEAATAAVRAQSPILTVDRQGSGRNHMLDRHTHAGPILLWAATATITVGTSERDWLVPPGYGLWIPAGVEHAASTLRVGDVRVLHFTPDSRTKPWIAPTGVRVGSLLRELILHLDAAAAVDSSRKLAELLVLDLLRPLPGASISVAMPTDARTRPIAERIVADPADSRSLEAWATDVHASVRTLSRLFIAETGLSFGEWRTRVRISAGAHLLAQGQPVAATARRMGYRKSSAFVVAFRRATGQTPGSYAQQATREPATPANSRSSVPE